MRWDREYVRRIEVRQRAYLWGKKYFVKPRFVLKKLGDGKQWIWLSATNTRPNYYVARIDSSYSLSNWERDENKPSPRDWVDSLLDLIEEQFGNSDDEYLTQREKAFPALDDGAGCSWGEFVPWWKRRKAKKP